MIDDRDGDAPIRLGGDLVLENLLDVAGSGARHHVVALDRVVAARLDSCRRNE